MRRMAFALRVRGETRRPGYRQRHRGTEREGVGSANQAGLIIRAL
jgi:hypothetical protein